MHKHLAFIKYKLLRSLQFRWEILLWVFLDMTPFVVLFFVLRSMYSTQANIHDYTASDMVFYYFIVVLIQGIVGIHFEGWRIEEIRKGQVDPYLLRPFSYLKEIVFNDIAGKLLFLTIFTPIYISFYFLAQSILPFTLPSVSIFQLFLVLSLLLFSYFLEMCVGILTVLLGFWFEGSQGLEHFKWISISLFSGAIIPMEFLPGWLRNVAAQLPLQYMYAIPINILQNRATLELSDILRIWITVIVLASMVMLMWKRALHTYTSSGG